MDWQIIVRFLTARATFKDLDELEESLTYNTTRMLALFIILYLLIK